MKKILPLFVFLYSIIPSASAQTIRAKGGINVNNMYARSAYGKEPMDNLIGFHIGGTIDIPVYKNISIEGGLLISQKGMREIYSEEEYRHRPIYLDFPIVGKYNYQVDNTLSVYSALGTYFGVGVGGTTRRIDTFQGINSYKRPIPWGSYNDNDINLKTTDTGIIFGGGVELNSFQFGVSYNIGVANILTYGSMTGTKLANRVFSLSLGYKLFEFN